jgi:hypothetical protein
MMSLGMRIHMALLCDVCERPLPDDDERTDILLFGVVRPCPGCKRPLDEEEWSALVETADADAVGA